MTDTLIETLSHPSVSVRLAACWCLRSYALSLPSNLPKLISQLVSLLDTTHTKLGVEKIDLSHKIRVIEFYNYFTG